MQIIFLLAAIISVSMMGGAQSKGCLASAGAEDLKCLKDAGQVLNLSEKGKAAYYDLRGAGTFETGHVGYAGTLSKHVISLNTLLEEKDAASALKALLDEAGTAGKLYALSGLYYADHDAFTREVQNMKRSSGTVKVMEGCEIFEDKIAKIVESDSANVAIIEPGKTMKEFWETNKGSVSLDIAHGGYPATFKGLAKP